MIAYPILKMIKRLIFRALKLIDRLHWMWLILAAPLFLFPSAPGSIAFLIVPGLWNLHLVIVIWERKIENGKLQIENEGFPITPLNLSLLGLMFMVLISTWATYSIEQSLEKISGVVLGLGVFFVVVRIGKNFIRWIISLAGFLAGGLAWAGLGFFALNYQVRFGFLAPIISQIPAVMSSLPGAEAGLQHNAVGGTILWYLPSFIVLSIYFLFSNGDRFQQDVVEGLRLKVESLHEEIVEKNFIKRLLGIIGKNIVIWILKVVFWLVTLFIVGVLVLTQSRGSYLALLVTIITILFLVLRKKGRWILSGLGIFGLGGIAAWVYQSGGWNSGIARLGLSGQGGYSIDSLGTRFEIWSRAIYGIQDFPITGMGMNTFREVVHVLYPLFTLAPDLDIAHAHNEFLQVALDLGILGLIAFLSIYFLCFWILLKIWNNSVNSKSVEQHGRSGWFRRLNLQQTLVLGLGGGLFGHMVFGLADAITLGAKPGVFYWYLLGLITSLYKIMVES